MSRKSFFKRIKEKAVRGRTCSNRIDEKKWKPHERRKELELDQSLQQSIQDDGPSILDRGTGNT